MKRLLVTLILILSAMSVWMGCSKLSATRSKDFTHSGCSADTRANFFYGDEPSLLVLKYEDGGLRVTRTNSVLNCAIKERGLTCKVQVKGDIIHYYVEYEIDNDLEANCICPVDEMSSLVTGLQEGKEYTFYFCGLDRYLKPVTFTFGKGLHQIIDVETL